MPPFISSLLMSKSCASKESLRIFNSERIAYVPPARNWGRVKAVFEDIYYQIIMRGKPVDKNYLKARQKIIDKEIL